ncbi:hypothetical protein [Sphingomonas endolithica]|uniref:hypothetical protein n=1 Tax=Sphingomonas endolithica TaxID=2972485 RepID=UPI0021AFD51A|nr:hypothetical protein [Sphingomonas sp. ZFBP2030]
MTADSQVTQGSPAWFEMVGEIMSEAAEKAMLQPNQRVSLVERYTDGEKLGGGFVQGFRFDIIGGRPSYRVGVRPEERGDITIEVSSRAARELNHMPAAASAIARETYLRTGEMRQEGDPSKLGDWFGHVHQSIVDRTK